MLVDIGPAQSESTSCKETHNMQTCKVKPSACIIVSLVGLRSQLKSYSGWWPKLGATVFSGLPPYVTELLVGLGDNSAK